MDKLRSLEYFIAAAEAGSFSGAARRLGVSVAAVSKLVGGLERSVGAQLFERHSDGLAPTAAGARYLESCRSALRLLGEADEQLTVSAPRGTVVVGAQTSIMQECLTPALPRFNALYPEIQLDIRLVMQTTEANARGVDVFVLLGWPQATDLIQRRVGATSLVICASPSYWNAFGMPRHPSELERHNCLTVRATNGTLMDVWRFQRGDERVSVTVRGWLLADMAQRDVVRRTVLAGGGVARGTDWLKRPGHDLATGRLVAALTDWEQPDVLPISVLYPASVRRVARVRAFIDFVTQLFRNIEEQRENRAAASAEPEWLQTHYPRASLAPARRR